MSMAASSNVLSSWVTGGRFSPSGISTVIEKSGAIGRSARGAARSSTAETLPTPASRRVSTATEYGVPGVNLSARSCSTDVWSSTVCDTCLALTSGDATSPGTRTPRDSNAFVYVALAGGAKGIPGGGT
jgi:hypothetical protein